MSLTPLSAISPVDGRYHAKTLVLSPYFSEFALIKNRVWVEIQYLVALREKGLEQLSGMTEAHIGALQSIAESFDEQDAQRIKAIEKITNHDVKAVEYFIKEKMDDLNLAAFKEFVHFGLTSQDINNTATPRMIKLALEEAYCPMLENLVHHLQNLAEEWAAYPMPARTHGQPASPTRVGKEIQVFIKRLQEQLNQLRTIPHSVKFGGATGNFNAHFTTYPNIDWHQFADEFVRQYLQMTRSFPTTQIEHYDNLAAQMHALSRINTILIDLCRDVWTYISMDYFKQKVVEREVGSSAMPHKVNPIDFENAEGNLGLANAIFTHLAGKLPLSRLQRDLTDSTVLRNVGVPFAHTLIAFQSIEKGLSKLQLHPEKLHSDLEENWMVVAEGIQNILRREGFQNPYETLKSLTRGKSRVTKEDLFEFIDQLDLSSELKEELKALSPHTYTGR